MATTELYATPSSVAFNGAMTMHELVAPYEFLIGTWEGHGHGQYPTLDDFHYRETITFTATEGKPFLRYEQRTANSDGVAMHTEVGYLRPQVSGHMEFVLAQPTGQTELLEGTATANDDGSLTMVLGYSEVRNTTTAKLVEHTMRHYVFDTHRTSVYTEYDMAAMGEEMQQHLSSELHKTV